MIKQRGSTTDTASGLEWLDVTLTANQSYDDIVSGFGVYAAAGYRHATESELCGFLGTLGDLVAASNCFGTSLAQVNADVFVDLLSETSSAGTANGVYGLFDDGNPADNVGLLCLESGPAAQCDAAAVPGFDYTLNWGASSEAPVFGNFLVRDAAPVPVPASLWFLASALAGLVRFGKEHD